MTAPDKHTAHTVVDWTGYLTHDEVEALKDLARSLPVGGRAYRQHRRGEWHQRTCLYGGPS
jgi:hypothetical protein